MFNKEKIQKKIDELSGKMKMYKSLKDNGYTNFGKFNMSIETYGKYKGKIAGYHEILNYIEFNQKIDKKVIELRKQHYQSERKRLSIANSKQKLNDEELEHYGWFKGRIEIMNEILEIINVNPLKKAYIETMKKMPKLSATSLDAVIVMQDYIQKLEKENKKLMIENENFKNINEKNKNKNKIREKLDYGIHPIDENTKGDIPKEQTEAGKYVKRTTSYKEEPYSGPIID